MGQINTQNAKVILNRLMNNYKKKKEDYVLWTNPLEHVIATVLAAQSTDKQVNKVTQNVLFKKYKTANDYKNADINELEQEIHSLGFFRSKSKYLKAIGTILVEKHNGQVPCNFDELLELPGVSNKTAYLVLGQVFRKNIEVAVDTHVLRLAPRLGLASKTKNANKISKELGKVYKPKDYLNINSYMILHGRAICISKPKCSKCFLNDICPTGLQNLKK